MKSESPIDVPTNERLSAPEPLLAREGLPFYLPPALVSLILLVAGANGAGAVFFGLALAVALFFRNPRRLPPEHEGVIVAPADGTLTAITDPLEATALDGQRSRRLSVFLSVLDVHINRYPCAGMIENVTYRPGKFFAAFRDKASSDNEQQATRIRTPQGALVQVVQIAGWIARRIVCYARQGEQVAGGDRLGLIRFGSRVDLWIPADWQVMVRPGQRMRGGETIIALATPLGSRGSGR